MIIYRYILRTRLFQTEVVGIIKARILCSIIVFLSSCRLWDNVGKFNKAGKATDDNIILRMRFSCWVIKLQTHTHTHTHTHSGCVISNYCSSTATMVARTLFNITLYVNWLSCVLLQTCFNTTMLYPCYIIMTDIHLRYLLLEHYWNWKSKDCGAAYRSVFSA
jgi:hypothetical protein